jgi:hypothetical protein
MRPPANQSLLTQGSRMRLDKRYSSKRWGQKRGKNQVARDIARASRAVVMINHQFATKLKEDQSLLESNRLAENGRERYSFSRRDRPRWEN